MNPTLDLLLLRRHVYRPLYVRHARFRDSIFFSCLSFEYSDLTLTLSFRTVFYRTFVPSESNDVWYCSSNLN